MQCDMHPEADADTTPSFLDLVDALTCKHQDLLDAYDSLLRQQALSTIQTETTHDDMPIFPSCNSYEVEVASERGRNLEEPELEAQLAVARLSIMEDEKKAKFSVKSCSNFTLITELAAPDRVMLSKSQKFGIDWDGETRKKSGGNSQRASLVSIGVQALQSTYAYRKDILDGVSGVIIIAYVIFLGCEIELLSRGVSDYVNDFFKVHMVFNSYFVLELILRFLDSGIKDFFMGKEKLLNWLDLSLVSSSLMDIAFKNMSTGSSRILRSIRVVRIVRMVRVFRAIAEVREFQKMLFAIASSMKTLACALVILFFVLYIFAVIFTYGAIDARKNDIDTGDLDVYWGTFMAAMYTCFISISTGQSWHYVVAPLSEYSVALTLTFCAFISITLFGVMNAITSIFVESALNSAQYYRDLIIADKEHEKEIAVSHMKVLFGQIDEDGSGEITTDEMELFLSQDHLRKYLEALNISADDTRMLFRLLDSDDSHVIDVTEFCEGCLKLKGQARALDVQILMYQVKRFLEKWSVFTNFVEENFKLVTDRTSLALAEIEKVRSSFHSAASHFVIEHQEVGAARKPIQKGHERNSREAKGITRTATTSSIQTDRSRNERIASCFHTDEEQVHQFWQHQDIDTFERNVSTLLESTAGC